ncbi:MAG: fluoride efflux transporter CrcB [Campylobacterales bacterium]|nr:fluoride efflux transporter CrcB [Campylobacterales bacterium]
MNLPTIIAVASGGALGALGRVFIFALSAKYLNDYLPWGTIIVNLIGSFIIGVAFAYFHYNPHIPTIIKTFIISGFLGALTTYSTFAIESFFLLEGGKMTEALSSILINLIGSIMLAAIGYLGYLHFAK